MKKEDVAPEYRSLQYVFAEDVAIDDSFEDLEIPASGLLPPL